MALFRKNSDTAYEMVLFAHPSEPRLLRRLAMTDTEIPSPPSVKEGDLKKTGHHVILRSNAGGVRT